MTFEELGGQGNERGSEMKELADYLKKIRARGSCLDIEDFNAYRPFWGKL